MIRKQLLSLLLVALIAPFGNTTATAQEIRLEPPQMDRQRIIRQSRSTGQLAGTQQSPVLQGQRLQQASGNRLTRAGYPQMGMSPFGVRRVARQEPIRQSQPRGIYEMATRQVVQENAAGPGSQAEVILGDPIMEEGMIMEGGIDDCAPACDPCVVCPPFQLISFADMEYSVGVQGFKGVPNLGESANFGFNQGINWGFPMPILPLLGLSGQIGFRTTQNDFYGSSLTEDSRYQTFVTAGLSRRVDYGFQMGVMFDYLSDEWYYEGEFAQLRAELGLVGGYGNTFGFRFTSLMQDSSEEVAEGLGGIINPIIGDFEPLDTYRFFYRQQWDQCRGGHVEAMGGWSAAGDALFGAEFMLPLAERWSLTSEFTALFPGSESARLQRVDETWNIGLGLTWYPKGLSTWSKLYHRPLMNVANNGSFMFTR